MPQIQENLEQRFSALEESGRKLPIIGQSSRHVEAQAFYNWSGNALSLIRGVFGDSSSHFSQFNSELSRINSNYIDERHYKAFLGIFLAAKSDFDDGFIFSVEKSIAGELFGDLVALAKTSLSEGHHTVAAVLASAALEDALKKYALSFGLDIEGKTMEQVVNSLKSKGAVTGAQKALLSAMPKVRNHAMHADWDKLTPQDAGSVIGFVESFLLSNFN
ncbi:DUF4145 domain-containing protein [uncultured Xanthomonas sp.]|uniref:DUF4145 domain-containing protein n=1 Tax=uncultured Xanthomonas sp. TaxID=152831 RepID=UPI0025D1E85F|nr:DUF4145 domain-containing protein [uncultured Xanthomonas sp.]